MGLYFKMSKFVYFFSVFAFTGLYISSSSLSCVRYRAAKSYFTHMYIYIYTHTWIYICANTELFWCDIASICCFCDTGLTRIYNEKHL